MKRIIILSIFAALLCGCVSASQEGEGSDTLGVESVTSMPCEFERPFISPDLKWQQLQGHVKQLKIFGDGELYLVYSFDRQGNFISCADSSGVVSYRIERNKNGQIVEWQQRKNETEFYAVEKFYYNSDGYICKKMYNYGATEDELLYILNERGWPISSSLKFYNIEKMSDSGEYIYKETLNYTYSNIDDHGNWLQVDSKANQRGYGSNFESTYEYTTTREITYWE